MEILAHGIDLVEVRRIAQLLEDHAERFRERCFTPGECAYCAQHRRAAEHFAARFAAKEAVLKALGTGLNHGLAWTQIEVTRDAQGRPGIVVTGRAAQVAQERGIARFLLSLSHTDTHAIASVIALGE